MSFTLNKTKDNINGIIMFQPYNIPFDKTIFDTLSALEDMHYNAKTAEEADEVMAEAITVINEYSASLRANETPKPSTISDKLFEKDGNFYLVGKGGVVSKIPIPKALVDKIISAFQEGISVEPYIKCWTLFLKNPNFTLAKAELFASYLTAKYEDKEMYALLIEQGYGEDTAKSMSTYNEVSITRSGLISTYKYVNLVEGLFDLAVTHFNETPSIHAENFKFLPPVMGTSGDPILVNGALTHNVTIGALHELQSWDQVNCDDRTSCVKGLHVGSQTYIRCYGGRTSFLINCLVSPSDIGAFVQCRGTADEGALRVLRYYPVSVNIAPNKNRYHESVLLDKVEEVWEEERTAAIEATNAKIKELQDIQLQLNAF